MELYQIKTEHPIVGYCESRIGGRSENQDSYGYHDTPFGLLIVVCDGMGGGPAGKTASSMAVSEILAGVMECEVDTAPKDVLQKAIQRANRALLDAIVESPELSGMGTTCTALLLNEQSAIMAHVGDSRIYQLRRHGKVFRTFDHSLVFDLVKQKVITEEQARLSDQSNIITRALGMKQELEIDIEERPYKKGDRFLLCTDGIHGTMPEKELMALATQRGELGNVVDGIAAMVDGNGKKNGGGHDNLTLVIVETKEKSELKEKMKNKTTLILGIIAAALAVIALVLNSCKNEDIDVDTFRIAEEQVLTGVDTVGITGTYDFFKEAEAMKINIGRDSTLADASSHAVTLTGKDYSVTVRNLQSDTTYYYRYSVNIGLSRDFLTPTKHFTTLALPPMQHYTVSTYSQPAEGGTVTGGGTYESGQQCLLTATPNEGYDFVNWTGNDSILSTDSLYIIMVYRDYTLTAHFEAQTPPVSDEYTVSVSANPTEGGTVSGGGNFQAGQSCTVRATANEGYTFLNWTENGNEVSSNVTYTFTVTDNRTLVANFVTATPQDYTISVSANPNNGGTVSGGGTYQQGQSCTVIATAADGYSFSNWTENGNVVSSNANYTFTVNSNRSLVAHFEVQAPNTYNINVSPNPSNGGTVNGGGTYQQGQSCTVSATANNGYSFTNWTENGNVVSSNASYSFTVTGNRTLVAHFTANPQNYTITVSANPSNGGTVNGGGNYQQGQSCTVSATANSGYTFLRWTENGNMVSTNASYTFTVNSNRTLVAQFEAQSYTISVSANPNNGGTVTGSGSFNYGQSCMVSATANSGYSFTNWTENGNVVSTNANYSFTVTGSRTLVAHFTANPQNYTISVSANPSYGGSVSGGGTYQQGQSCTVTATANSGYTFSNWTENGNVVSTNVSYTFTVTSNRTLVANFTAQPQNYVITLSANPNNGGTLAGGGTYQEGQQCTVSASANNGFEFSNWTENGNVVSWSTSYTFTVTSNRTFVANFTAQPQNFTISVSANPSNGGTVSGGGTYQQGQSCTVSATANSGYTFTNWTENSNVVSTSASYTFTVAGNRSLVAHFTIQPQAPTGAINGLFSVSATQQVWFSQGNLQYKASTNTWRFAEHQYDYIGNANSNISQTYSGWIDLFGWGTSGWNNGNTYYHPWDSNNWSGSLYGPPGNYDLTGIYANADWGVYNPISNGGNQTNQWRTLTDSEWGYVFHTRTTTSGIRYAKANVNNVNGVILLPDDWSTGTYSLSSTNTYNASFSSNTLTTSQWSTLEQAGAVFLPAAGFRGGTSVDFVGSNGVYQSTSCGGSNFVYTVYFDDGGLCACCSGGRCNGFSVRLVRVAEN